MEGKSIKFERKKPKFYAKEWHKLIRLGSQKKSKRKWAGAKGRHNKIRLGKKGHSLRPKIGWSSGNASVRNIRGINFVLINNLDELKKLDSGTNIVISSSIGARKRILIIEETKKMKINILNKYRGDKK